MKKLILYLLIAIPAICYSQTNVANFFLTRPLAADPTPLKNGMLWYNTNTGGFSIYENGTIKKPLSYEPNVTFNFLNLGGNPDVLFRLRGKNTFSDQVVFNDTYNQGTGDFGASFTAYRAGGTEASPTNAPSNVPLFNNSYAAYFNGNYQTVITNNYWLGTNSANPTSYIEWQTHNGTSLATRMRLNTSGVLELTSSSVRIGTSSTAGFVLTTDANGNGTWQTLPSFVTTNTTQTITAAKTFNDNTLLLNNVAGTFASRFTNTNTAAQVYTLPNATGTVSLIGLAETFSAIKTFSAAPVFNALPTGTAVSNAATASTLVARDANNRILAANIVEGYSTTATAAATTTLLVSSNQIQQFTGTTTQTVVLPVATTLSNGHSFRIVNTSTGIVTVNTSGGNTIKAMAANSYLDVWCINTAGGTGTASWNWIYTAAINN